MSGNVKEKFSLEFVSSGAVEAATSLQKLFDTAELMLPELVLLDPDKVETASGTNTDFALELPSSDDDADSDPTKELRDLFQAM